MPEFLHQSLPSLIELRRHLHQHPELGFEEFATSDLVAQRLEEWGYEVHRGLAGTGVVGQLKKGTGSRSIGLRADMDALPINEETALPHASSVPGKMHGCGHDGHTVMLLAAAHYLAEHGSFNGTLNVIFQPAEEGLGGAQRMVKEGLFERFPCDGVFGLHNMPGIPVGTFGLRAGPFLASSDTYIITINGHGGHGALPHTTTDPVVAAAHIVVALQSIVARNVAPLDTAIITVGAIHAGDAPNVIPETAELRLSVRALNAEVRALLAQRIRELVTAEAQAYCCSATIDTDTSYPVLVNDTASSEFARQVILDHFGEEHLDYPMAPVTGSEDFSFMLEACKGAYVFMGNGGDGNISLHSPYYDFNDEGLAYGACYWIRLAERFLV
ncbi:M20 aminoacylase family protein [Carnimonas bestiolae]|uniref:M20 aminoacylase family protein n=1 Tax=Carnimonas bestiolae TaxID=3402172 RepID=UPI003F4AF3A7